MSGHDSSSPPPPPSPPHDATAQSALLPPPRPPTLRTPLLAPHPGAESEVPSTLHGLALVAAPSPSPLPLPPPVLAGHDSVGRGGAAGAEPHLDSFLPPGYRFHPQDGELVTYYLGNKVEDRPLPPNKIFDVRLYDHNPEYLAAKYPQWGENKWFFFTPRERKYPNGHRPNRAAGDGYWKATGSDKPVTNEGGARVGVKKALVFYRGKPPNGDKTNWIMNEYRIEHDSHQRRHDGTMKLDDWVLCSIHESPEGNGKRPKRYRDEAKPCSSASRGKRSRGRKPQPSSPWGSHMEEAALAQQYPKVLDRSDDNDGGSIPQTLNDYSTGPHEGKKSAHLELPPYIHETCSPYQHLNLNGYHEPFMEIGDLHLHGKYEKLNSIGCLNSESGVPGSDSLPWTTNYQWMPEPLALNDYMCTHDDVHYFMRSSEKYHMLENTTAWGTIGWLGSVRDLISGADAIDALISSSCYSRSNPLGYDMFHSTNATDSTNPQMDAMAVTPGAIHEAGSIPTLADETPNAPAILKNNAISETSANAAPAALKNGAVLGTCANAPAVLKNGLGLNAGAYYGITVPNADAFDWESGLTGEEELQPMVHSWAGRFNKF